MDYSKAPFEIKRIFVNNVLLVMRLTHEELKYDEPSLQSISDNNLGRDIILTLSEDLPKRFGTMFNGQTCSFIVSIISKSSTPVKDITYTCEIKTPSDAITLEEETKENENHIKSSEKQTLEENKCINSIYKYLIKEIGVFSININVKFLDTIKGKKTTTSKSFKFQVEDPIKVVLQAKSVKDHVFIETTLKNISSIPFLHEVTFVPYTNTDWSVKSLDIPTKNTNISAQTSVFKITPLKNKHLIQGASRKYLYLVYNTSDPTKVPITEEIIGHVKIQWWTLGGETGIIETDEIKTESKENEILIISNLPDVIHIHKPFTVTLTITNSSDNDINGNINYNNNNNNSNNSNGIILETNLHEDILIKSNETVTKELKFIPTLKGFFTIKNINIMDKSGKTYNIDPLPTILVQ